MWKTRIGEFFFFFSSDNSRFVENGNWRILVLWKTRIGEFFSFFFFYPRILVLLKRRILVLWKTGTGGFSFCGKAESEIFFFPFIREFLFCGKRELKNSRFGENQIRRTFFFFLSENSRFVENGNLRILVLWKTRIGESFFFYPRILVLWKRRILVLWKTRIGEFFFFFIREFSFCAKRELENSRFEENQNGRIVFFFSLHRRILVLWKTRILVLWKTRIREFSFCGKPRIGEISFCRKRESENSRFLENETPRIPVLWKTGTREFSFDGKPESEVFFFFFFIREFSFCGKRELENSRFVENQNRRIFFFFIREFSFC